MISSGNSKLIPNTNSRLIRNPKYCSPDSADLYVAADGQQEPQGGRQHDVGQHRARDEQHRADADERHREPAFLLVQAGGDERPQLVQPDRAGHHQAGRQCHLEAQHELVERAGRQQPALAVGGDGGAGRIRQRTVRTAQPFTQAVHTEETVGVPEEPEDGGDQNRGHRDQQTVAQFLQVVDQRHRAVGVDPRAAATRIELFDESGGHGRVLTAWS